MKKKTDDDERMSSGSQSCIQAYERLRRHALQPGSVSGIENWVVLIHRGMSTWLAVATLGECDAHRDAMNQHALASVRHRPPAANDVAMEGQSQAMLQVLVAMLSCQGWDRGHEPTSN